MIKFSYKDANGSVQSVAFNKYYELLRFVASNRVADEAFVSMNLHAGEDDSNEIVGLDGLVNEALDTADRMEEAEQQMEAMMAELFGSDDSDYEAEDFEEE